MVKFSLSAYTVLLQPYRALTHNWNSLEQSREVVGQSFTWLWVLEIQWTSLCVVLTLFVNFKYSWLLEILSSFLYPGALSSFYLSIEIWLESLNYSLLVFAVNISPIFSKLCNSAIFLHFCGAIYVCSFLLSTFFEFNLLRSLFFGDHLLSMLLFLLSLYIFSQWLGSAATENFISESLSCVVFCGRLLNFQTCDLGVLQNQDG